MRHRFLTAQRNGAILCGQQQMWVVLTNEQFYVAGVRSINKHEERLCDVQYKIIFKSFNQRLKP